MQIQLLSLSVQPAFAAVLIIGFTVMVAGWVAVREPRALKCLAKTVEALSPLANGLSQLTSK